MVLKKYI